MKITFPLFAVAASLAFASSATAAGQESQDATEAASQDAQEANGNDDAPAAIEIPAITAPGSDEADEAREEKRICRRVRLDMSSRRSTRVCKTSAEWREFNQPR